MKFKSLFLVAITMSVVFSAAFAQSNCFDTYSNVYKNQKGEPVTDGMQKVVVAVKDSNNKANCIEGKIVVKDGAFVLPLYILRENGSYTETYGKLDNSFYRNTLGKIDYSISDAMSAVFMLQGKRKGRIFFPDFLKDNTGKAVQAPPPGNLGSKPKQEDIDKLNKEAKSIQFETGKAVLTNDSYALLDGIAMLMKSYPDTKWAIDGFTDNVGNEEKNTVLSEKRAMAVEDYLIKQGVNAGSLYAAGHGSQSPIADNKTPEGRKLNRRVEIKPI